MYVYKLRGPSVSCKFHWGLGSSRAAAIDFPINKPDAMTESPTINQLHAALLAIHQTPPSLISPPVHQPAARKPATPGAGATPLLGPARHHFANTKRASVAISEHIRTSTIQGPGRRSHFLCLQLFVSGLNRVRKVHRLPTHYHHPLP